MDSKAEGRHPRWQTTTAFRDRAFETEALSAAPREFRTQVQQREPELAVELGIMEFDGSVQYVT